MCPVEYWLARFVAFACEWVVFTPETPILSADMHALGCVNAKVVEHVYACEDNNDPEQADDGEPNQYEQAVVSRAEDTEPGCDHRDRKHAHQVGSRADAPTRVGHDDIVHPLKMDTDHDERDRCER